jgi:hypothetical protein
MSPQEEADRQVTLRVSPRVGETGSRGTGGDFDLIAPW